MKLALGISNEAQWSVESKPNSKELEMEEFGVFSKAPTHSDVAPECTRAYL
jgi:hypothetical protein